MTPRQTQGRTANGATPGGKPDATTSEAAVRKVGTAETRSAGPDGPDAKVIGDSFKTTGG